MNIHNPENSRSAQASDASAAKPRRRWLWILLSLCVLLAVMVFLMEAEDTVDVIRNDAPPPHQLVSVETVTVRDETAEITSFGEIRPRWSADLRAAISGRVIRVHDNALAGERVDKGTPLITLENSRFVAELAAAELALKQAKLKLWQAKNAHHVAFMQYKRSKTSAPNDLALKLPQLDIAKSEVRSAKARVAAAQQQVRDAVVVAPFSGFVTDRFVSPGQSVNLGDSLIKLVDNQVFELTLQLGLKDWRLLKQPLTAQRADILDQQGRILTQATIRQGGGFLDETTRQYKIFLEINGLDTPTLLSGDFVTARLTGRTLAGSLNIPASSYTQQGYIWYLAEEDRLQRVKPHILFRRGGRLIIKAPTEALNLRIAVTPLASFLPGMKINPQNAED